MNANRQGKRTDSGVSSYCGDPVSGKHETVLGVLAERPSHWALFLDIDGTLLEIAPRPEAVVVPGLLTETLAAVSRQLDGALALVTGRAIRWVDRMFAPHRFPVAGLHGVERRMPGGRIVAAGTTPSFLAAKETLRGAARKLAGVVFEDKGCAMALHYRHAPQHRDAARALMQAALEQAGPEWALQAGKMVFEIRPAHANKGTALRAFMADAPFAGRRPIAIGDDLTDEDMFAVALEHAGHAIRVGAPGGDTLAGTTVSSPRQLRRQLAAIASGIPQGGA